MLELTAEGQRDLELEQKWRVRGEHDRGTREARRARLDDAREWHVSRTTSGAART